MAAFPLPTTGRLHATNIIHILYAEQAAEEGDEGEEEEQQQHEEESSSDEDMDEAAAAAKAKAVAQMFKSSQGVGCIMPRAKSLSASCCMQRHESAAWGGPRAKRQGGAQGPTVPGQAP